MAESISIGEHIELAEKFGYPHIEELKKTLAIGPFIKWAIDKGIFKSWPKVYQDKRNKLIKKRGHSNVAEYYDKRAQELGFANNSERAKVRNWNNGKHLPMEVREDCNLHFGIHKGETLFERFLLTIFEYVEHMKANNKGFDFICENPKQDFIDKYPRLKLEKNKKYRIQLAMRCWHQYRHDTGAYEWTFAIAHNNMVDYFIFCGWDKRDGFPIRMWMFHKNEIIRGEMFWYRSGINMINRPKNLLEFQKYELIDELEKLRELYSI